MVKLDFCPIYWQAMNRPYRRVQTGCKVIEFLISVFAFYKDYKSQAL
jgi:hypothetical protein